MEHASPRFSFLAVGALLLGAALLITNLTQVSLWADEGWTIAATAEANPVEVVTEWVVPDVHPPLYFLALNGWRAFTGDTIFEMRYFSVLVTLLGIALTYKAGDAMLGKNAGVLAATFYALHDLVLVQTQEVRHYPGQMALVAAALWTYWRFYRTPNRQRGIVFVLMGAALLYTHYWGGLILAALALHALMMASDKRRFILAFVGIGVLFLPWVPALIHQITLERPNGLPHALENTNLVYRVLLFQLIGTPEVFWLVMMAAGAAGVLALDPRRWWPSAPRMALLLAVIVPPLLSIGVNTVYPILSYRALAVVVPPAMLLAAAGMARFRLPEQAIIAAFVIGFSLTNTAADTIERPDWPQIATYTTQRSDDTDLILLENDTDEYALAYYVEQAAHPVPIAHTEHVREYTPEAYPAYLEQTLAGVDGLWVAKLGWPGEPGGDIRPELAPYGFFPSAPEREYGMYNNRPILLWRLDRVDADAAPQVTYGESLRLLRADAFATGDNSLSVNLLWSPDAALAQDVTVSILLFGPQGITNQDSRPIDGDALTSNWTPDGLYFDSHTIDDLPPGTYRVAVQVYYFTDANFTQTANLPVDDCSDDEECRFIFVGSVEL